MLYTYCSESLSYKKVKLAKKPVTIGFISLLALSYFILTGMISAAKEQGFQEATELPVETELLVLEAEDDQFSQDALVEELSLIHI